MDESMSSEDCLVNSSAVDSTTQGIVLETFGHQVGGRSLILTYDHNTVCKPLNPEELRFYLDLPESLRPFTPRYKGVIKVDVQVSGGGKLKLISNIIPRETCDGDIRFNTGLEDDELVPSRNHQDKDRDTNYHTKVKTEGSINPWTFHCHNLHYKSLTESVNKNKSMDFMLMEDLVHNYTLPCIMDLKMGNVMHSSYTDEEKYAKQKAKVNASTSKTLGLRIAGTQIYNRESKKYVYHNKYYGFQLSEQGFQEELSKFLHNEKQLRKDVVVCFVDKLQELYTCLEHQDKLQFFSSSILLIYEGQQRKLCEHSNGVIEGCSTTEASISHTTHSDSQRTQSPNDLCADASHTKIEKADVKMIDFARSIHYTSKTIPVGPDKSYLLGLRNLIKMLKEILHGEQESHQ